VTHRGLRGHHKNQCSIGTNFLGKSWIFLGQNSEKFGPQCTSMRGEELVETWRICCGWAEEFCINTWDHRDGFEFGVGVFVKSKNRDSSSKSEPEIFPGFVGEPFGMRPICNYHLDNGEFPHQSGRGLPVTKETWELLVSMCGYMTEEDGEVCFETDLIEPKLEPLKITDDRNRERKESEMDEGEMLTLAKYAAETMGLVE